MFNPSLFYEKHKSAIDTCNVVVAIVGFIGFIYGFNVAYSRLPTGTKIVDVYSFNRQENFATAIAEAMEAYPEKFQAVVQRLSHN